MYDVYNATLRAPDIWYSFVLRPHCFVLGTLPGICYPNGMESYLRSRDVLLIDYPRFAAPFTERLREHVEQVAKDADIKIEFVRTTKNFRKETRVQEVLQQRGVTNGSISDPLWRWKPVPPINTVSLEGRPDATGFRA